MRMPICFNVDMTKEYDVDRLLKFALQRARMKVRKEEVITIITITTTTITIITTGWVGSGRVGSGRGSKGQRLLIKLRLILAFRRFLE